MRRREFITLIGGLAIALALAAYAQQPIAPPKRIGILDQYGCPIPPESPLPRRLAELGWVEGQNIVFDCVSAVGRLDQVPVLARELVSRHPDALTAGPFSFVSALKRETTTIPIVMLATLEPGRLGLITSFARPGGNVTGVTWFSAQLKIMQLLKEVVPNLRRVAYITEKLGAAYTPPEFLKMLEEGRTIAAGALGFTWQVFPAAVASDYDEIFARLAADHFDAAYIVTTPFNVQNQTRICQLVLHHMIPTVSNALGWARTRLLVGYAQDYAWSVERDGLRR